MIERRKREKGYLELKDLEKYTIRWKETINPNPENYLEILD
ncbi:MAG: hypothetical protein ACXABG_11315 [Promethearchaeota archaeon]|jgi:hypothetical protein